MQQPDPFRHFLDGNSEQDILGDIDALKLRSSMTLFGAAVRECPVFNRVLERFYAGEGDPLTLELIESP